MMKNRLVDLYKNHKDLIVYDELSSKELGIIDKYYPDFNKDYLAIRKETVLLKKKIYLYTMTSIYLSQQDKISLYGLKGVEKKDAYIVLHYASDLKTIDYHDDLYRDLKMIVKLYQSLYHKANEYEESLDYHASLDIYKDLLEVGYDDAIKRLGVFYELGLGVHKDSHQAISYYQMTIVDDEDGEYYYDEGKKLFKDKNYLYALTYFLKAKDHSYSKSLYYIGQIYHYGLNMNKDLNKAERYYKEALESYDHERIHYQLALLYKDKKDYESMLEHLDECHDDQANYLKGKLYHKGIGVKKNLKKAKSYYKKAVEYNTKAYYSLSSIALELREYDDYFYYLNQAYKVHDKRAKNHLGLAYERGRGVTKDYTQALYWYNEAIKDDNPQGYFNKARLYRDGKGVDKDLNEAVNLFEKAASYHHGGAYSELGKMYIEGSLPTDIDKGVSYIEKGVELDSENAKVYMAKLCVEGQYVKEDPYYAYSLLKDAMEKETNGVNAKRTFIHYVLCDVFHLEFEDIVDIFNYALEVKREEKDFEDEFYQFVDYYKKEFIEEYIIGCAYNEMTNALFFYRDKELCYFIDCSSYQMITVPYSLVRSFKKSLMAGTPVHLDYDENQVTHIQLSYEGAFQ